MRAMADYLQHAIECRRLAEGIAQPQDKKILEEIADAWEKIAALREKDLIDAKGSGPRQGPGPSAKPPSRGHRVGRA
jgi:hypothetical protein